MHGRRRRDVPRLRHEDVAKQREKVVHGFALLRKLLDQKQQCVYTKDVLADTKGFLEFNPEMASVWNYRKDILNAVFPEYDHTSLARDISYLELSRSSTSEQEQWTSEYGLAGQVATTCTGRDTSVERGQRTDGTSIVSAVVDVDGRKCDVHTPSEARMKMLRDELVLTHHALQRSGWKSYAVWFHRVWTLASLLSLLVKSSQIRHYLVRHRSEREVAVNRDNREDDPDELLRGEMELCELMHQADGRNFHCWQHWAMAATWLEALKRCKYESGTTDDASEVKCGSTTKDDDLSILFSRCFCEKSLALSRRLIESDFSNYSAWYLRSLMPSTRVDLSTELEWLWQGIYTEPMDQSLWQYYTWLLCRRDVSPRLVAIRSDEDGDYVQCIFFYFAETCEIDATSFVFENDGKSPNSEVRLPGEWRPFNRLYSIGMSGWNSRLLGNACTTCPLWVFKPRQPIRISERWNPLSLRVDFIFRRSKSPLCERSKCIDIFHSRLLKVLRGGFSVTTMNNVVARPQRSTRTSESEDCIGSTAYIFRTRIVNEIEMGFVPWYCKNPCNSVSSIGSPTELLNLRKSESRAAAGGCLAPGVSECVAKLEIGKLNELLVLEPYCKGALNSRLRLLRALEPDDISSLHSTCANLADADVHHRDMYEDFLRSASLRGRIRTQYRVGANTDRATEQSYDFSSMNLRRVTYPVLLQAVGATEMSFKDNSLNSCSTVDWHVPFLPRLQWLDLSRNSLEEIHTVLISVLGLPSLKGLNLSYNPLRPYNDLPAALVAAIEEPLQSSPLTNIEITATPLSKKLADGDVIYDAFRVESRTCSVHQCSLIRINSGLSTFRTL